MDDLEKSVRDWDRRCSAMPTFEEVRDVEFVRRSGKINMLTGNVLNELFTSGRLDGAAWLVRCRENGVHWASYWTEAVKLWGDPSSWLTSDEARSYEIEALENEAAALEAKARRLRAASRRAATCDVPVQDK